MRYLPACILLACGCIVEMHLAMSISCLVLGILLTFCALGTPTQPLVYAPTMESAEPMFLRMMRDDEDEDGPPGSRGDFDYE